METEVRRGHVTKTIELRHGETNVYCRHVLRGFRGKMCLGHHAMLRFPRREKAGLVAVAPFKRGQVLPVAFGRPDRGSHQSLRIGARFAGLGQVPATGGGFTDLTAFPARAGVDDLVMISARSGPVAWTAVSFPRERYLWFGLRDPRVLPSTLLWFSNGGRLFPPWNGRHRCVLGLEDIVAYFDRGLAASVRPNGFSRAGIPTAVSLSPRVPFVVNSIMGVVAIPRTFGAVTGIRRTARRIEFIDAAGRSVRSRVEWRFLRSRSKSDR
jgi:hypothetical protein